MMHPRFIPFVARHITRHRARTALTVLGVAVAMFLFSSVQSMQSGVREATEASAAETTLVVYRENRYCPFTSQLPQHYERRIANIDGVRTVIPMRIQVSNCRASLDVVTFRGVPRESMAALINEAGTVIDGSVAEWEKRTDAAILGQALAERRKLKVGDRFSAAGLTVYVAGILESEHPQDRNCAYTHLSFIQEAAARGSTGGIVTQFNVKVDDPQRLEEVASAIDAEFARDQEPTSTYPEKAFVARAARDIVEIVDFAGWLGWGALAAVLALIGNAIVLAVQSRIRDHAVLQTLGYRPALIARLIVAEGLILGLIGGTLGGLGSWLFLSLGKFSLTMEGLNIEVTSSLTLALIGLGLSAALGALAGLVPAWQVSRRTIASCFRAV